MLPRGTMPGLQTERRHPTPSCRRPPGSGRSPPAWLRPTLPPGDPWLPPHGHLLCRTLEVALNTDPSHPPGCLGSGTKRTREGGVEGGRGLLLRPQGAPLVGSPRPGAPSPCLAHVVTAGGGSRARSFPEGSQRGPGLPAGGAEPGDLRGSLGGPCSTWETGREVEGPAGGREVRPCVELGRTPCEDHSARRGASRARGTAARRAPAHPANEPGRASSSSDVAPPPGSFPGFGRQTLQLPKYAHRPYVPRRLFPSHGHDCGPLQGQVAGVSRGASKSTECRFLSANARRVLSPRRNPRYSRLCSGRNVPGSPGWPCRVSG